MSYNSPPRSSRSIPIPSTPAKSIPRTPAKPSRTRPSFSRSSMNDSEHKFNQAPFNTHTEAIATVSGGFTNFDEDIPDSSDTSIRMTPSTLSSSSSSSSSSYSLPSQTQIMEGSQLAFLSKNSAPVYIELSNRITHHTNKVNSRSSVYFARLVDSQIPVIVKVNKVHRIRHVLDSQYMNSSTRDSYSKYVSSRESYIMKLLDPTQVMFCQPLYTWVEPKHRKEIIVFPLMECDCQQFLNAKMKELSPESLADLKKYIKLCYKAMVKLHNAGFVHGDIKLDNFLLDKEKVYLTDFGCSIRLKDNGRLLDGEEVEDLLGRGDRLDMSTLDRSQPTIKTDMTAFKFMLLDIMQRVKAHPKYDNTTMKSFIDDLKGYVNDLEWVLEHSAILQPL